MFELTSGTSVGLLGQQFLNLLGEVSLAAPHEADDAEHHEHGDQAQPERLLQHASTQTYYPRRRVRSLTPVETKADSTNYKMMLSSK